MVRVLGAGGKVGKFELTRVIPWEEREADNHVAFESVFLDLGDMLNFCSEIAGWSSVIPWQHQSDSQRCYRNVLILAV